MAPKKDKDKKWGLNWGAADLDNAFSERVEENVRENMRNGVGVEEETPAGAGVMRPEPEKSPLQKWDEQPDWGQGAVSDIQRRAQQVEPAARREAQENASRPIWERGGVVFSPETSHVEQGDAIQQRVEQPQAVESRRPQQDEATNELTDGIVRNATKQLDDYVNQTVMRNESMSEPEKIIAARNGETDLYLTKANAYERMTPDNVKRYLEGILSEPMTLGAIYDEALAHGMKAEEYVDKVLLPNIEQKVAAEMVARHTPKSTLEYLASSTLHQSLLGRVMLNLSNMPKDVRALKQEGLAQYDEGLSRQMEDGSLSEAVAAGAEKLGAMALPFVADAGPFRLLGAVSNVAGLGRIARVSALSGNGLLSTAARMGLHEGGTFGLYEGTSGLLNDIAQDDVSVWQAAKNFGMNYASGALTGFALGSVKTGLAKRHEGAAMLNKGHFGKPQEALRAGEKFAATTAVFAVSDVMKRWATDFNFDINDVDWGDVLANSALTTMMIELAAAPDKIRAARAQKEALANIHFTEADKTAFRNAGIPVVRDGDARKWLFQNAELYADLDPRQQLWNRRAMDIVENKVLSVEQKNTLLKAAGLNPVVPVMETTKVSDVQPYVVFDGKGNPVTQYRVDEFDGYGTFQKRTIFATEQEAQQYREEIGEPVVQNRLKFWQQQSETIKLSKATPMAFEGMSRRGTNPKQMSEILAKDEKTLTEGERKVKEEFLDVRQKFVDATETFYDIALAETAERHGVPEEAVRGALESDSRTELGAQVTNDFLQLLDEYSQPDVLHDKSAEEISRMLIPEDELEQLRTEGRELYASGDAKAMHEQVLRFRAAKERANDGNTADRHLLGYYLRQKAIYDAMLETHNGNHSEAYSTAENFAKSELMADADGNVRVVRMGDKAFVVLNADMDSMIVVPVETAQDGTIDFASADRSRARTMMRRDAGEFEMHNVDEVMRSMYSNVTAERDAIFGDTKPEVGQVVETVADEQGNVVRETVVNNDGNGTWLLQREDGAQRAVTEEELTQMLRKQEQRVDDERYFKEEVEAIKAKNKPQTKGAEQAVGQESGEAATKAPEGVSVPRDADGNADLNGMAEVGTSVVNAIDALSEAFDGDLARAQRVVASKVKSLIKQGKEVVDPAGEESGDLNAMAAAARERSAERAKLGREQEYWLNLLSEMTGRKKEVLVGDIDNPDNYRQPKEIAREQIEKLAGKLGVKVEFTDNMYDTMMADASIADKPETVDDANQYNGYRRPDGTIVINTNSEHALVWTMGHETGHQIEKAAPQQYEVLKAAILDTLDPRFIAEKLEHLKGQDVYSQDKENELLSEIANDGLGRIFTDERAFGELMKRLGVEETKTLADRIKSWVEQAREQGVMSALKQTWDSLTQKAQEAHPLLMDGERGERLLSLAENAYKEAMENGRVDKQGNPIDENGKLILENVKSLDEISDDDFIAPKRNIVLPQIPENLSIAIGAERKPVIIKKNIFEKNKAKHPEISSQESRSILHDALYNTNIVGNAQPIKRPDYRVAIHTGERNSVVVLDIYRGKDNVEIVGWRRIDEHGLRKMKKQAEREGGQFLILSPKNGSAAALSALPRGLSSESKGKDIFVNDQENGIDFSKESEKEHENARLEEQYRETKRLMAVKKDYEKGLQAGRELNWRSLGRGGINEISVYGLEWGLNNRIIGHRPNSIISEGADGGRIKVNMSPQNLVDTRDHIDALERLQREYVAIRKSPVATDEARRVIDSNIYAIDYAKRYYDLALQGDNAILKMEAPQFSKEDAEPKEVEKHPIFLSNAEVAVRNIKQDKATAEQWLAMAEKMGGIKAGEDKWMGLSDWLRSKKGEKLTKDGVLKYIMDNSIQVEEEHYSEKGQSDPTLKYEREFKKLIKIAPDMDRWERERWAWDQMVDKYGRDFLKAFQHDGDNIIVRTNPRGEYLHPELVRKFWGEKAIVNTRLRFTTRGLTNKREIALVVPGVMPYRQHDDIHFGDAGDGRAVAWVRFGETKTTSPAQKMTVWNKLWNKTKSSVLVLDEIQSQRFEDEKKRGQFDSRELLHLRNEVGRLLIEQSDLIRNNAPRHTWGSPQAVLEWVKADAVSEETRGRYFELERHINEIYDKLREINTNSQVPDAPFEKNWHELVMKRMLRYAAENGYDKLAWTTGAQQAERYGIGAVIDQVERTQMFGDTGETRYDLQPKDNSGGIALFVKDGVVARSSMDEFEGKPLEQVVGKELAAKMLEMKDYSILNIADMPVGGEGMRGFYDEILPRFMNKYGKKWGVKVYDIELPNVEEAGRHMWAVDITPEMKESVMQGQVMFSKENAETLFKEAKKRFGRTYDLREAGYILPDGMMLDFSGKHWLNDGADASSLAGRRTVDHRDIRELAYERDGNTKTGIETDMTDFIRSGAIRIDDNAGLINLSAKPTPEQRELLRRLVSRNGGQVQVEIGDGDMSEAYVEYDNAKPSRVLADIDRYFDEGIVPQGDVQFSKEDFSINSKKTSEDDWQIGEKFVSLHSERDREAVREQRNSMSPTAQWREGVGDVMIHSILPIVRKKYADLHEKAKAGDVEAAFRLVKAVVKEDRIRALAEQHPNANVAFVHAEEATGTNRIPEAYANELADYGFGHTDIVQTNKPQHTGSDRIGRMIRRARFDGDVEAGTEYILVDDHVTMGGTLRDLKDYIESKGGKVVAVTTLTASAGGSKLQPTAEQIEQLKQKGITNEQLKELGIADDIAGLTKGEARELLVLADARADRRPASGRPRDLGEARRSSGGREKGNGQGVDYSKETPAPREGEDWKDYAGRVSRWMNQKQRGATDSQIDDLESIRTAIAETDTNPSEAEKKSGNYKMGHAHLDGYQITIENPAGSVRRGTDPDGKAWETKMHYTYGYIRGTRGKDGDHIDIFLSENPTQGNVYVVDQVDPKTGKFDEHKVMYGFNNEAEARDAYLSNYEEGWNGLGDITGVSKEEFRKWVNSSVRKTKPFSEYASVRDAHLSGEQSDVSFSKDGRRKRHSAQLDLFGNPQLDLFRDHKSARERIRELADGDLLQEIGSGEMRDWDFYQEEYDRRHNNEYGEEMDSYTDMLIQGKTSLNDAYQMYADVEKQWRSGGYATEERTALRAQMDALTDYIDRLEFAEGDEVQGLEGYTRQEVLDAVRGDVEEMLEDSGVDVEIKGMALNGSRLRGDARKDSDLDVVLEYDGDVSEDALFNILNENPIEFDGIKVDINPITEGKSGTLEQYMARSRQYDEEVGVRFSKESEDFAEKYSGGNEDKKAQIAYRISKINTIKKKFGPESLLSEESLVSLQREIKKPIDHFYNVVAEKIADEYINEKFGSGTNVIDPDELRERTFAVVGYDGTNVSLYGKNDDLIAKVYRKALAKAIADNNPTVILLTGHAGAGKSTSLRTSGIDTSKAGVVYDSAFNTYESLARAINTAKEAGVKESDIRVVAVYNDPVTSFSNTLARAKKEGRTVPFNYFFGHAFVSNNGKIRDLSDNFPEVNIVCLDNSRNISKGEVSLDEAKDWDYEVSEQQFEEALKLIEDEINRKERGLTEHQITSIARGLSGTRRLPHRLDGVAKRIEVRLSGNGRRESVGEVGGDLTPGSGVKFSKDSDIKKGKSELWKRTWDEVKDNAHYRDMMLDLEPHTIEEVAAGILRGGGLLWGDVKDSEGKVLVKGVRSFMGYKKGEFDKFLGLFTSEEKGGRGFERVGEEVEVECQRLGIPYDENDPMAGVNALQEVLSECGGKGQLNEYVQYRRVRDVEAQIKADQDAEMEALDEEYYDRYGMDKSTYDQIFDEVSGEKERRKSEETIDILQRKIEQQNEKMERMWTELKAERTNKEGKAVIERLIQQNKAAREAALRAEQDKKAGQEHIKELEEIIKEKNKTITQELNARTRAEERSKAAAEDAQKRERLYQENAQKHVDSARKFVEKRETIQKQLIAYIREQLASEWLPWTTRIELNKLLTRVRNTTTQDALEKAMREVRYVSTSGMVRAQQQRLDRMLALKVQGVNGKNMSIAKTVDDRTRLILQGVRQRVMDNKMVSLLERMDDLRRNRMKANAELRRLRRDGYPGGIVALEEEVRKIDERIASTEQEIEKARQARPGTQEGDIDRELKALEEKMDRAARKESVWTTEDTDLMTQLRLMQALAEPREYTVQEAEARKQISDDIDLQRELSQKKDAETDEEKRHELMIRIYQVRGEIDNLMEVRNQAQMARSEALSRVIRLFDGVIKGGRESLQAKMEREAQRRIMLIRDAVHSVWGKEPNLNTREGQEEAKKSKVEKYWKALVSAPVSSFDYMTQKVATDGVGKDSWLYRYFMEGKNGMMEAYNTYLTGMREQKDALNAKVEELFGTKNSKVLKTDAWVKQAAEADKMEDHSGVTMVDAYGNRLEMPMSKGQATYIWARWQMADGKVKLQNQGFDDTSIAEIEKFVGPKYIELAKWLSGDFLAGSRAKYNERYREMYNTSMARIENYVPMGIFKGAVRQQSDLSEDTAQRKSLETRAGSLINRKFNVLPVDITQSIFDAISAHVEQMENWYAYARVRRDLDAILSNTYFRNQLNANHAGDFERFYEAAAVATKSYIPNDAGKSDESISILNKGLIAGNIAFRLNTALKQLLSAPAYLGYSQNPVFMGILAKNCATGALGQNWKWCYDHIPSFRERVDVGDLGDNRLSENTATAIGQRLQRYASIGMIPNRIVDGVTVSIGTKAIHDYALRKYLKLAAVGNPTLEERAQRIQEAHRMAKMEADIFYNQTQQSSHPAFLSPMQLSRSLLDRALTVYQNANLGYTRAMMNAARDLISAKDYQRTVNGLARRYEGFGLSVEDAMRQARQDAWKKYPNLLTRLGLFGWGLKCVWNWGSNGLLGFLQNDDDEKRKDGETQEQYEKRMALRNSNDFVSYLLTPVQGTGGGNMLLTAKDIVLGEDGKRFEYNPILFLDQLEKMLKDVSNDIQDGGVINSMLAAHTLMHISKFSGIDPQTWGNIYIGVEGLVKDGYPYDDKLIDIMYILNTPRSGRMEAARTLFMEYRPNATEEEFQKVVGYADGFMTHDSWLAKYMPGVKDAEGERYAKEYKTLSGEYQRMQNGPAPEKEESAAVRGRKAYRTYVRYEDIAGDADVENWHRRALDVKKKIGESSKEIRELGLSSSLTKQLIDVEKTDHEYELNIANFYADYNKKRGALIEKLTGDKESDQDVLADIRRLREDFLSTVKDKDKLADKVWDIKNE